MGYLVQPKRERVISNGNETKIKAKITATKALLAPNIGSPGSWAVQLDYPGGRGAEAVWPLQTLRGRQAWQTRDGSSVNCRSPLNLAYVLKSSVAFNQLTQLPLCMCLGAQSCPTLCDPSDYSPPGSSVHGIFEAWILSFPSPWDFLGKSTGVACHFLTYV